MKRGVFLRSLGGGAVAATATVQLPWWKELWTKFFPPIIPTAPVAEALSLESLERAYLALYDQHIMPTVLVVRPELQMAAQKILCSSYQPMMPMDDEDEMPWKHVVRPVQQIRVSANADEEAWYLT